MSGVLLQTVDQLIRDKRGAKTVSYLIIHDYLMYMYMYNVVHVLVHCICIPTVCVYTYIGIYYCREL